MAAEQGVLTIAYVRGVLMGNGEKQPKKQARLTTLADAAEARGLEQMRQFVEGV